MTPEQKIAELRKDAARWKTLADSAAGKGYAALYLHFADRDFTKADELEAWLKTPEDRRGRRPVV